MCEINVLNILITAGGTSEKIDSVRRITNTGTGKLGTLVAEAFISGIFDTSETVDSSAHLSIRIVYICSANAVRPRLENHSERSETSPPVSRCGEERGHASPILEIVVADDVAGVEAAIRSACEKTSFDVIVHSMAISDYIVKAVGDSEQMAKGMMGKPDTGSKISSDKENLIVVLEKAPKLIGMLRGLAKDAVIVGFKLLSGVSEEELIFAGRELLLKNDCDFVLANDMKTVFSGRHEGLLIDSDGNYEKAAGKEAIADLIVRSVLSKLK